MTNDAPRYSPDERQALLAQFARLPEMVQADFLTTMTANPDISGDSNKLAAQMQVQINHYAEQQAAQQANPFAALLAGVSIAPELLAMNAQQNPDAVTTQQAALPGKQRGLDDGGIIV